jgi:hypothetical protein
MTKELFIFGDIAGNYNTLLALLNKKPAGAIPVSVGDMVDRGPRSKQVLEYFMHHGLAVMGNHEHMMIDHFTRILQGKPGYYEHGVWSWNGGDTTLNSFRFKTGEDEDGDPIWSPDVDVDADIINWLSNLPLYLKFDAVPGDGNSTQGLIITHGPIRGDFKLEQCLNPSYGFNRHYMNEILEANKGVKLPHPDDCVLWNRGATRRKHKEGYLQVHGHNSRKSVEWERDEQGIFAVNLDTSRARVLTAMHWPSLELFEQEYID